VAQLRRLNDWGDEVPDAEVAERAHAARREKTGNDFLPHYLHRVIAIACVMRDEQGIRVRSLGSEESTEARIVQDFFRTIERYTPQLVSWNGSGFDMPVLHYRALVNGVAAHRYWDVGDGDRDFRWNNYISRYHQRHLDLMDVLASYQGRAFAPLSDIARMCAFPGKLGMEGSAVWPAYQAGQLARIRAYCETDAVNTWLVYCRFQLMRGVLTQAAYDAEIGQTRTALGQSPGDHWQEFLAAWP